MFAFFLGLGGLILTFFVAGEVDYYRQRATLEEAVRDKFGDRLFPLPVIDYGKVLGRSVTEAQADLGRLLFNDPILSRNNDTSCATCHLSNHGFADHSSLTVGALGKGGANGDNVGASFGKGELQIDRGCGDDGFGFPCLRPMFRNVLSTVNVAYRANRYTNEGLLWDGRFGDLDFQTILPIHTGEELCGTNPVPQATEENIFREGGPLFQDPIQVTHSHLSDMHEGRNFNEFNAQPERIRGVPSRRPNGTASIPVRNECLAIAVAKLRKVPEYRKLFNQAFDVSEIQDYHIGRALASFVATHVAKRTPYDEFVAGKHSLTLGQLKGLAVFMASPGEKFQLGPTTLTGAGCVNCHAPPLFGGSSFSSLGVVSDPRSVLSHGKIIFSQSGFLLRFQTLRGTYPTCHKIGITAEAGDPLVPDMGRAHASSHDEDCFKFRVPTLRNVIETGPYFHHGTARGQGATASTLEQRNLEALRQVIAYHLRGPVNIRMVNRQSTNEVFYDPYFQMDPLVPSEYQSFLGDSTLQDRFPILLNAEEFDGLLEFVAYGLHDPKAVQKGDLGNLVSHPKRVPSGFTPSITRDHGKQNELPPNGEF